MTSSNSTPRHPAMPASTRIRQHANGCNTTVSTSRFRDRWNQLVIDFAGITKQYPDGTVAVDDLTLEEPDGTLTVFVGPAGCGKTTSMRMINRMIEPTSGTLPGNGEDVTKVDPVRLRLGIGYVIQHAGLMPHQRVIDNVATVPVLKGKSRRDARQAAYGVLERVGLDSKIATRHPAQLSGGEQQRVGVARALAADPPILLMDEPFSAVDPIVRVEVPRDILGPRAQVTKTIWLRKRRRGALFVESVALVGSPFRPGASLSQALDAALSSPAAIGVAVDKAGKVIGGVRAGDVLAVLESQPQD